MGLPMLQRCCFFVPLETGCIIMCIFSMLLCFAHIVAGSWNLPRHRQREPEDNVISMSMVMFSTLSLIVNFIALIGMRLKRPSYVETSVVFNSVFMVCIFLVSIVTVIFSPELSAFKQHGGNLALLVILLLIGAVYSLYYLTVLNSVYRKLNMVYGDSSALPV